MCTAPVHQYCIVQYQYQGLASTQYYSIQYLKFEFRYRVDTKCQIPVHLSTSTWYSRRIYCS